MSVKRDCKYYRLNDFKKSSTPENIDPITGLILHICDFPKDQMVENLIEGNIRCNIENDYCPHNPAKILKV
jgi:hypothetical protein